LEGCNRFLHRVWRLAVPGSDLLAEHPPRHGDAGEADLAVLRATHRLVAEVSECFQRWSYNVAVARAMAFVNDLYRWVQSPDGPHGDTLERAVDTLLELLAPTVPHITAELWARRHTGDHVHDRPWPQADPAMLVEDTVTLVIQVDGKVRDRIEVPAGAGEEVCVEAALGSAKVQAHLDGEPRKVIARPPKLVNLVT
jgi:leucyl-tRNA synthetase